jgi:peptidyl-prolyl cis-trans isomerase C
MVGARARGPGVATAGARLSGAPVSASAGARRGVIGRVLREPLLHFAALGGLLFALHAAVERHRIDAAPAPPTAPAYGPVITVGEAELATLRATFKRSWKREPDPEQLGDLVSEFIADEVLFREGAARGLDRDDAVVRQRIIEKMRVLARPTAASEAPSRERLEGWFRDHAHRFRQGSKFAFEQIYFDPKRRAAAGEDAAVVATQALARLTAQPAGAAVPEGVGDSFVLRRRWDETAEQQIVNVFGEGFAQALSAAPLGRWSGPVRSEYGVHLVHVSARRPGRMPAFEEAEAYVRADYQLAEGRALGAVERDLLPRYRVELSGAARELAPTSGMKALLGAAR